MRTLKQIAPKFIFRFIIFYLCAVPLITRGQPPLNKITFQHGRNVQFIYNSLSNYNIGINLIGYTTLTFRFNVAGSGGWKIELESSSNNIDSNDGYPDIPIASLNIQVEGTSSITNDPTGTINSTPFSPAMGSWTTLAEGNGGTSGVTPADDVTVVIVLTYMLDPLLNWHEGSYNVNLDVELVAKP